MSSTADVVNKPSAAINVGFSSVADQHGESSSRAGSRSSGKRSTQSDRRERESRDSNTSNHSKDESQRQPEVRVSGDSAERRPRSSGGFLLDSVFANGSPPGPQDPRGKRKAQDGQLRVDKRRHRPSRLSNEPSLRSSPLSRNVSTAISNAGDGEESRTPSMDPAQLVQMALNLSENRKRHVSNTLQVPLTSPRRAASGPMSNIGTVRATSAQRRTSQLTNGQTRNSTSPNAGEPQDQYEGPSTSVDFWQDNVYHAFAPATLSRAEKARKYFELAHEHRRLLDYLPPLKPDSTAPGNYTFESVSSPGSAYPEISRVPSGVNSIHVLGRQYNPIQSLRNRRIRIREKKPFPAQPETWQDPDKVKAWIDEVETATKDPYYRATPNKVHLPTFTGDDGMTPAQSQTSTAKHRRTETVGSVITRPENSWTIEPIELLADAYWTEKRNNKSLIESRHGNTIFPSQPRHSQDTAKISVELHRGRSDVAMGNETDDAHESAHPSRRRRLMLPLKGNSDKRKYHHIRSRSTSVSSTASTEDGFGKSSGPRRALGDENIGPLERHMQELIAKDANGEMSSPEVISPDHWDHKNLPHQKLGRDHSLREPMTPPNGRASLEVPRDQHRRARSADGRVGSVDRAMSSTEDLASEPTSPIIQRFVPSMGMDLSSPIHSRRSLEGHRTYKKLPGFRSRSKDRNGIDQTDFAEGGVSGAIAGAVTETMLSPIFSNDSWRPRSSQDSARPPQFVRHRTNESSSSGLQRLDTNLTNVTFSSTQSSTMGRLLKGGRDRLGGIVRGDAPRFSDRFRNRDKLDGGQSDASRGVSDISDVEDEKKVNGTLKKRLPEPAGEDSDISPRASIDRARPKGKYHLSGLPSFTSASKRPQVDTGTSAGDPPGRQQKLTKEAGKAERLDRLAPPRIDLPKGGNASSPDLPAFRFPAVKFDEPRKSYGDLAAIGPAALAVSPFGNVSRSPAQRHWSIYDMAQPIKSEKITSRDIARVRALLLCSGIKAREIQRLSNLPREKPGQDLVIAAKTAGRKLDRVPLKEEHLIAAQMLSAHLTSTLSDYELKLSHFQSRTVGSLASRLDELQHRASDHLTNLVHDTSDEADAFTVELTTRQPQQTKQVDDAIDAMIRQRRRKFRLLRRAGFKLLEWLVLSIMWWIWFLVVVFQTSKKVIVSIIRFLHWLFVF